MTSAGRTVALVVPTFPKLSETFVVRHFSGLLERGWNVHVVCASSPDEQWAQYPELDLRVLRSRVHVAAPTRPKLRAALHWLPTVARSAAANPRATNELIRSVGAMRSARDVYLGSRWLHLRPDLIHFEFGTLAGGRFDLARALGSRTVVSFRGFDLNLHGFAQPGAFDEVWERADGLHFLSESLWRTAMRQGCPKDKRKILAPPCVVPRDLPVQESEVRQKRTGPLEIVTVGRLVWQKGSEYALMAIRRLLDQGVDCRFTIIGDGPELGAVSYARHQLGLKDRVRLVGAVPPDEVYDYLDQADVYFQMSVTEGFGNSVLEAQSRRLPAVVSDAGGLPENVVDGTTGFVVARRDPEAATRALKLLASDRKLRERMGHAARERVLREFRPEVELDRFETLYRSVLGEIPEPSEGMS